MSDSDDDDLGINMIAGCGCAAAASLFVLAPLGFGLGLFLGNIRWALILGTIAGAFGPIVLTFIWWGVLTWRRCTERENGPD